MISSLSSSFRILSLHNAIKPETATKLCKIRDVHLGQPMHYRSVGEKLSEVLGLPKKPKKPIPAFFLYLMENRRIIAEKNPQLMSSEVISIVSKTWRSLDHSKKLKYVNQWKEAQIKYLSMLTEYQKNIVEYDKKKIDETKVEITQKKREISFQKKLRELKRPKRFRSPFLVYLHEQTDRRSDERYIDFVKRTSSKWKALSQAERENYKISDADKESYSKTLCEWESQMTKLGHFDVIRYKTRMFQDTSKRKTSPPMNSS